MFNLASTRYAGRVRAPWLVAAFFLCLRAVAAQPVRFELRDKVPVGQKPMLKIVALQRVADIRLELDRDDGRRFASRHAALAKGQSVTLAIGDGAAGKAEYTGTISVSVAGEGRWSDGLSFQTVVSAPLKVAYDADNLDLDARVLRFKPSRAAAEAQIVAIGEDGEELGKGSETYDGEPAGSWLAISWSQPSGTRVMKLRLRVVASDGAATNVELIPWSVVIEHEDVNFRTDSAVIEVSETRKLDASLAEIYDVVRRAGRFMKMNLYVAGHTDTVGGSEKNRRLSVARALAIASYFRRKGLGIPIMVAGFGEDVLKVDTGDNTDERANRRADYVIGPANAPPPFRGPYLKARVTWKRLR